LNKRAKRFAVGPGGRTFEQDFEVISRCDAEGLEIGLFNFLRQPVDFIA